MTRIDLKDAAAWLSFAAAPTFAVMAALTATHGDAMPDMLCSTTLSTALTGMAPMYLLMSAFHAGPWLKLIGGSRRAVTAPRSAS